MDNNYKARLITIIVGLFIVNVINAQVPVREEPRHHPVLVNKYIRLLDVWIKPGDTTQFHIHATPSLFVILSNTNTVSQIKGEGWQSGVSNPGTTWYRSFTPDVLVHRVANIDTIPFHVNDIEILSSYHPEKKQVALAFPLLFENEKAFAYQLKRGDFTNNTISHRGPMIVELISGDSILLHGTKEEKAQKLIAGKYFYIEPDSSFNFMLRGNGEVNLVLFELK
jgi:hypothetical protein